MALYASRWVKVRAAGRTFYRFAVAYYNRAQYDFKAETMVQSFHPRFRVVESGDYSEGNLPQDIPRSVLADLAHRGIALSDIEGY